MYSFLKTHDSKNLQIKKKILGHCVNEGNFSLADLSKEINISIPTIRLTCIPEIENK